MSKRFLVVALVFAFVLMVAGIAYALPTNTAGTWDGSSTSYNYNWPQQYTSAGSSGPHGGYDTTTNKCRECHAVHRASGSWKLTRADDRWMTCDFCHGSGVGAGTDIQMADAGVSNGHHLGVYEDLYAPDTTRTAGTTTILGAYMPPATGFSCFDCHTIHGNVRRMVGGISDMTSATGTVTNMLLGNPNTKNERGWCSATVDMTDWCADCHAGNIGLNTVQKIIWDNNTDSWDTGYAHDAQTNGYTTNGAWMYTLCNSTIADTSGYAYVNARDGVNNGPKCRQCHTSASDSPFSWPHSSAGYVLLTSSVPSNSTPPLLDLVCLTCHNTLALP